MYMDNLNYLGTGETCKDYNDVVDEYFAARDVYPDALYYTRIIAIQFPTDYVIAKFEESLKNKYNSKPADIPIDLYFANNYYVKVIDTSRVVALLKLAEYTKPAVVTIYNTHLEMSGFEKILETMIANKEHFTNLHTLKVMNSDLNIGWTDTIKSSISAKISEMCNIPAFANLTTIILMLIHWLVNFLKLLVLLVVSIQSRPLNSPLVLVFAILMVINIILLNNMNNVITHGMLKLMVLLFILTVQKPLLLIQNVISQSL